MNDAIAKADIFRSLHVKGDPLILYNIWDAGSAAAVAQAGAKAIATGSWAVAAARGYEDGEKFPLDSALDNLQRIVDGVGLPVSVDLESGYGRTPQDVADTVARAIARGAAGFNLEDQITGANALYDVEEQSTRIRAARTAAEKCSVAAFINARCDVFMLAIPDAQIDLLMNEVLIRTKAYHQAGADGLFVPGLVDGAAIEHLCNISPLPVNIMVMPDCPRHEKLAELGVARISYGPGPYQSAMDALNAAAKSIYS